MIADGKHYTLNTRTDWGQGEREKIVTLHIKETVKALTLDRDLIDVTEGYYPIKQITDGGILFKNGDQFLEVTTFSLFKETSIDIIDLVK